MSIHASFQPLIPQASTINIRKKSSWSWILDCRVILSERGLNDIEQLITHSKLQLVTSNKIKKYIYSNWPLYMTLSKHVHHRDHRPWRQLRGGICRYKTFWVRIFARTTLLLICCSIHVKLCVLATYSARNWVQKSWLLRQQCTAVSPMSGSPTCDIENKTEK